MPSMKSIFGLLQDPPPSFAFELSERGIAAAQSGKPLELRFESLGPDVISVSPLRDNVLLPDTLASHVRNLTPVTDRRKRRRAVLILPDYAVRITVLDFDSFPASADEQKSLIRFRLRKTIPFDVESAALSYHAQPPSEGSKKVDVIAAVVPLEIVARYEAPFRNAGLHPGLVTTSTLAALQLVNGKGITVLTKVSGRILTVAVLLSGTLKLLRCIELGGTLKDELSDQLYPTFAYAEDTLSGKVETVITSGLGADADELRGQLDGQGIRVEPLRSRMGTPDQFNAGLLGYLESTEAAA